MRRDRARDGSTSTTRNGITYQNTAGTTTRPSLLIASAGANATRAAATTAYEPLRNSTARLPWRGIPASQDTAAEDDTNNRRVISATQGHVESAADRVSTAESNPVMSFHPRLGDVCHPGQRKAAVRAEKQMKTMIAGDTKS